VPFVIAPHSSACGLADCAGEVSSFSTNVPYSTAIPSESALLPAVRLFSPELAFLSFHRRSPVISSLPPLLNAPLLNLSSYRALSLPG